MNLPTREECQNILKASDGFFVQEKVIEGQKVELYNYRLASINDFVDNNAFELRGICFVEQSDGSWERNLLMNKFYNYSQTVGWMPEDLDDKKIVRIQDKEDGSVISFVRFENGKVLAKSKMSFSSEQAVSAQKIYNENEHINDFVNKCLDDKLTCIMELVGYSNQIVLNYSMESELRLLHIRDKNGRYFTTEEMKSYTEHYNIKIAEDYDVEMIENVTSKYTIEEAKTFIGDRKFKTLDEMIRFLG